MIWLKVSYSDSPAVPVVLRDTTLLFLFTKSKIPKTSNTKSIKMEGSIIWASLATAAALLLLIVVIKLKKDIWKAEEDEDEEYNREMQKRMMVYRPHFIEELKASESLIDLFTCHIRIWGAGIRPHKIGPDKYGMYRTEDILTMKPEEVFLGGIYGLWTFPLTEWEKCKETNPGDYKIVLAQYQTQLLSNLEAYSPEFRL